jgi:hypothetical protein
MIRHIRPSNAFLLGLVLAWLVLLIASISHGAPPKAKLNSEWPTTPVVVDGKATEWPVLVSIAKDIRFSIGVRNDDRFLYLVLVTSDRATAFQTLTEGLVVWLDAAGGSKKQFGFRYPVGGPGGFPADDGGRRGVPGSDQAGGAGRPPGEPPEQGERGTRGGGGQAPDVDTLWKRAESEGRLKTADLLGARKEDVRTITLGESQPIQAKIGRAEGMLIYELAIPLSVTPATPDAAGVKPGAILGVGLETPERSAGGRSGGDPGGPPGMGGGGGGMGGPPGMGGGGGGMGGPPGMGGGGGGMGGRGGSGGGMSGSGGMGGPPPGAGGPGGPNGQQTREVKAWTTVQLVLPPAGRSLDR